MTIPTTQNSQQWAGNGTTTSFSFDFVAGSVNYLAATYTDASGNVTNLTLGSTFNVTLNAAVAPNIWGVGGTITPNLGFTMPAGSSLTLVRNVPDTQLVSLSNQGASYPNATESAIDIVCMEIQQTKNGVTRSVRAPTSDVNPQMVLPNSVNRASQFCAFDENGNVYTTPGPLGSVTLPPNAVYLRTNASGVPLATENVMSFNPIGFTVEQDFVNFFGTQQNVIQQWGYVSFSGTGSGGYQLITFYFPTNFPNTCEFFELSVEGLFDPTLGYIGFYVNATDYISYVSVYVVNIAGTTNAVLKVRAIGY